MFILIHTLDGIMDQHTTKVRAYKTHDEAWQVMQREFDAYYHEETDDDEYRRFDYALMDNEAWDGYDQDSPTWNIFEIKE